jgi:abequosyltransferase
LDKTLAICIPTHNRARWLAECLPVIIDQAREYETAIYVSDNASSDDTRTVILGFQAGYPWLFYRQSDSNLGFDRNVDHAVRMAEAEYIWTFSDDDLPKPGALAAVRSILSEEAYDVVIVNSEFRGLNLKHVVKERLFPFTEDKETFDASEALLSLAPSITFLPSLVFRKRVWAETDVARYIGKDFVHVGAVFDWMGRNPFRMRLLATPMTIGRTNNSSWMSRDYEIWMLHWPETIEALPDTYSRETKTRAILSYGGPLVYLRLRALGMWSVDRYNRSLRKYCPPTSARGAEALLIGLLPVGLMRILYGFWVSITPQLRS